MTAAASTGEVTIWEATFDEPGWGGLRVFDWDEEDRVGAQAVSENGYVGQSLYLGDPACGWFFNGDGIDARCETPYPEELDALHASGVRIELVSPEITLPHELALAVSFWVAGHGELPLDIPGLPNPDSLVLTLHEEAAGISEILFDTSRLANNIPEPTLVVADISPYAGRSVRLRFVFDTYGPDWNRFPGWWLDELRVLSTCRLLACANDASCLDRDACTVDRCTPFANGDGEIGVCAAVRQPPDCRACAESVPRSCDDGDPCTLEQCVAGACQARLSPAPGCCAEEEALRESFPSYDLPAGWSVEDDGTAVRWQVVSDPDSGESLLYFGDPATSSYDNGGVAAGRVLSAPLTLPEPDMHLLVHWRLKLSTEFDAADFVPQVPVDRLSLLVVREDERGDLAEEEVWSSAAAEVQGSTHGAWQEVGTTLGPWAGQEIRLAFEFHSHDELGNLHGGAWIDDLVVESGCGTLCAQDAACDDGDACTEDRCQGLLCRAVLVGSDCCDTAADCLPPSDCTTVRCDAGRCAYRDDLDDATCCDGVTWFEPFDAPGLEDYERLTEDRGDPENPVSWQASGRCAHSPPYGLFFGDDLTGSYASGFAVAGSVLTPRFFVPTSGPYARTWARFRLLLDTEWNGTREEGWVDPPRIVHDALRVYAVKLGVEIEIWSSFGMDWRGSTCDADGVCEWRAAELDLTPFQGISLQLRFVFDSLDELDNDYLGVCIDDLEIVTACDGASVDCLRSEDCGDGDSCTADRCVGHRCEHWPTGDPSCCAVLPVGAPNGWEDGTDGGWSFSYAPTPVRWQPVRGTAHSGTGALYFGDPARWTYADPSPTPGAVAGTAYSPTYTLPWTTEIKLSFWYLVDVEPFDPNAPERDRLELWIFDHLTGREQLLWSKRDVPLWHYGDDGPRSYTDAQASIGRFAGSVVSFEWRFDSVDATANEGRGVLIDDWRIEAVVCP